MGRERLVYECGCFFFEPFCPNPSVAKLVRSRAKYLLNQGVSLVIPATSYKIAALFWVVSASFIGYLSRYADARVWRVISRTIARAKSSDE